MISAIITGNIEPNIVPAYGIMVSSDATAANKNAFFIPMISKDMEYSVNKITMDIVRPSKYCSDTLLILLTTDLRPMVPRS